MSSGRDRWCEAFGVRREAPSLPWWERKRFQRLGFSQVLEIASEGDNFRRQSRPLSCKIYDLAEAKLMILLSPPQGWRRSTQHHRDKIIRHFSTPPHPVPSSSGSRCRMDRERVGPGGREALWSLPKRAARIEGRRRPSRFRWRAVGSTVQSQPPGRVLFRASRKAGCEAMTPVRACGGHDGPMAFSVRAGTSSEPHTWSVQAMAGAIRAEINSRVCKAPPVGCGHHPAKFGPRASCATNYTHHSRGKARVRPSGNKCSVHTPPVCRAGSFGDANPGLMSPERFALAAKCEV